MSVNLLDLAQDAIGSQLGSMSGILGESEQDTKSLVSMVIPAILGGLMKKGSTDEGANQVFKTLDDFDGGVLENLGGLLSGGNHTQLLNKGGGLLDMIFGSNRTGLLGTLARMSGLRDSKIGTLLGLLAPVVMGVLGKQRRSQGLDVGGLANMLSSQKEYVAPHVSGELGNALGLGDIFGERSGAVSDAAVNVGDAVTRHVNAPATSDAGGGLFKALLPLLLLGAIAIAAWKFLPMGNNSAENSANALAGLDLPKINLPAFPTQEIGTTFVDLTKSIGGVSDAASAETVLPKIEDAGEMFDTLDFGAIAAGPEKEAVGGLLSSLIEPLQETLAQAYAIPGVEDVLKPKVDALLARFAPFGI